MQVLKLFWMVTGLVSAIAGATQSSTGVKYRHVVVEHAEPQILERDDDLSKYDTFNISNCLAIVEVRDEKNAAIITRYEVIGISTCLADAAAKTLREKEIKTRLGKSYRETATNNVWNGPGYGSFESEQIQNLTMEAFTTE